MRERWMAEAEVSLRLASWLVRTNLALGTVEVAIDGAQLKTGEDVHFDLSKYCTTYGWRKVGTSEAWQADYCSDAEGSLRISSNPGKGDVVASLRSGHRLRVECKKGPLDRSKSSSEYKLVREALGQILTVSEVGDADLLAVAFPHGAKFVELAERWRRAPLVQRLGIQLLTVTCDGDVFGFNLGGGQPTG